MNVKQNNKMALVSGAALGDGRAMTNTPAASGARKGQL